MMINKITQKRAVFYILFKAYQKNPEEFIPTWHALGELEIPELDQAFFMSYKTPTNGFDIFFENPDLIERQWMIGKSGTKYYTYRLKSPFVESHIVEQSLKDFWNALIGKNPEISPTIKAMPDCPACNDRDYQGAHKGRTKQHPT